MLSAIGTGFIVLKAAILVLFFLVYLFSLRSFLRSTPFSLTGQVVSFLINLAALAGYYFVLNITVNSTYALILVLTGVVIGFLLGSTASVNKVDERVYLKRSFFVYGLLMLAYLVSIFFNLFGTKILMSMGLMLVIAATVATCAGGLAETLKEMKAKS